MRIGILATHPIQYYAPWYRALASIADVEVFFSQRQSAEAQAAAGFGVAFEWDVPLLDGYAHRFLRNIATRPDVNTFWGCNTPELSGIIAAGRFDAFIVHGWYTYSFWQAMTACWRTGTPLLVRGDSTLVTPRSWMRRAVKWPLYRWFIPRFDGYLVVGSQAREYVMHYGADPRRCFDAPHAVNNAFFAAGAEQARAVRGPVRQAFGLPTDAIVCLFVGKFIEGKETSTFVRAVAAAARRNSAVAGLMAGDGPLRADLEREIAATSAPVHVAGFLNQREMVRAYAASDVLVVPSAHETWGLVVNEAMAAGLPAIVSDGVGAAADLVEDDVTGYVFPVGDAEALARRIAGMAGDANLRRRLGENARHRIDRYDVTAAASGTVAAVAALATTRPARAAASSGVPRGMFPGAASPSDLHTRTPKT